MQSCHVVKLRNNTPDTTTGRCLCLDLTDLRHTAASEESIQFARDILSRKTSAVNWVAVFAVAMSSAPAVIKAFH